MILSISLSVLAVTPYGFPGSFSSRISSEAKALPSPSDIKLPPVFTRSLVPEVVS